MAKYIPLFKVSFLHGFYADKKCKDIQLEAIGATAALFKNAGVILKALGDSFQWVIDTDKVEVLQAYCKENEEQSFDFKLTSHNSLFVNFTDLDPNKIVLLENSQISENQEPVNLSQGNIVSGKDAYDPDSEEFQELLATKDRYIKPIGFVRIYLKNLIQDSNILSQNYYMEFSARSIFWHYFIIWKRLNNGYVFKIEDVKQKYKFSEAKQTKLSDGTDAYMIQSLEPIPLQSRTGYVFQLKYGNQRLIKKLPMAPYRTIYKKESPNRDIYYSKIFIYN